MCRQPTFISDRHLSDVRVAYAVSRRGSPATANFHPPTWRRRAVRARRAMCGKCPSPVRPFIISVTMPSSEPTAGANLYAVLPSGKGIDVNGSKLGLSARRSSGRRMRSWLASSRHRIGARRGCAARGGNGGVKRTARFLFSVALSAVVNVRWHFSQVPLQCTLDHGEDVSIHCSRTTQRMEELGH